MTTTNLDQLQATAEAATEGPWVWSGPKSNPDLEGVVTETYSDGSTSTYTRTVLEVDHDGGCCCRAVCELDVTFSDEDRAFVAAFNPQVALELLDRVRAAEARVAELEG